MVMAQQYFLTHTGVDPATIEKARNLLDVSYKKLTGFESRSRGYEWFGADPGHEALTAYGLLQFTDMSHVRASIKTCSIVLARGCFHDGTVMAASV